MIAHMTADAFQQETNVSRETVSRLESYAELLNAWQKKINLVGRGTIDDVWRRHMLDSAQLVKLLPEATETVTDLGSGGGFPGMVVAIMTGVETHLIEANTRKTVFLREAARITEARVEVHNGRIEEIDPWQTDIITARGLAPLDKLLNLAYPFLAESTQKETICLFLKGSQAEQELTCARKQWNMQIEQHKSASGDGRILSIRGVTRGPSGSERVG